MNNLFGGGASALASHEEIERLKKEIESKGILSAYQINEYPNIWDAPSGFYTLSGVTCLGLEGIPSELKKNARAYLLKGKFTDQSFCAVFSPLQASIYTGYHYGATKTWKKLTGTIVT